MKYLILFLCLFTADLSAQSTDRFFDLADDFFQQYVQNGKVKYAEIQQNPKALNEMLAEAKKARVSPENPAEYKAFWINAYNLAVINGIVQKYPVASPLDIEGFFDKQRHSLAQKSVTLDQIEHDLLFENFPGEDRFHFVLVCAAKGCPEIIAAAYRPETLEDQLQKQTEAALNNPDFVKVRGDRLLLSELMKWYQDDFTRGGKALIQYINQFRKVKLDKDLRVDFYKYNWDINDF